MQCEPGFKAHCVLIRFHMKMLSSLTALVIYSYLRHIQQTINRNLHRAMLGGVPDSVNLVKSYLNISLGSQNPGLEVSPHLHSVYVFHRLG